MKNLNSIIESILFAANKPMAVKDLADITKADKSDIEKSLLEIKGRLNHHDSGIFLLENNKKYQLTTNPDHAKILQEYFQTELTGELSKASLETLTIVAYRQPISKEELEQIRGVNCGLILRNLLIRGLVEYREEKGDLVPMYSVTMDFLRHLGISDVKELPDFEKLNSDENLQTLLEQSPEKE